MVEYLVSYYLVGIPITISWLWTMVDKYNAYWVKHLLRFPQVPWHPLRCRMKQSYCPLIQARGHRRKRRGIFREKPLGKAEEEPREKPREKPLQSCWVMFMWCLHDFTMIATQWCHRLRFSQLFWICHAVTDRIHGIDCVKLQFPWKKSSGYTGNTI